MKANTVIRYLARSPARPVAWGGRSVRPKAKKTDSFIQDGQIAWGGGGRKIFASKDDPLCSLEVEVFRDFSFTYRI